MLKHPLLASLRRKVQMPLFPGSRPVLIEVRATGAALGVPWPE